MPRKLRLQWPGICFHVIGPGDLVKVKVTAFKDPATDTLQAESVDVLLKAYAVQ
jgi:hypothetical protein